MEKLKTFDAYAKTIDDFRIKTTSGAVISLLASALIFYLILSEFLLYLKTDVRQELSVDRSFGEKLRINVDITFPRLPCSSSFACLRCASAWLLSLCLIDFSLNLPCLCCIVCVCVRWRAVLSLDAMDVSGELQIDIDHDVFKKRLDLEGRAISGFERDSLGREKAVDPSAVVAASEPVPANYCGSCYGSESSPNECCNTCDQVRDAYRKKGWAFVQHEGIEQCVREGLSQSLHSETKEGCSVTGHLVVNKMAGNVHVAPGKSYQMAHMHVHDIQTMGATYFNLSHVIRSVSFGTSFPGVVNPLDGVAKTSSEATSAVYSYYIKVVPTTYTRDDGTVIKTNQYSVTEHSKLATAGGQVLPGVFFIFELSPLTVQLSESSRSFAEFVTSLMAIVGGVFTVAGLVDAGVYHTSRSLAKKLELGKHS